MTFFRDIGRLVELVTQAVDRAMNQCRLRWRAGILVDPAGNSIPDGTRCLCVGEHKIHKFKQENGKIREVE